MAREDYIEVSERLVVFYERFPNGSLQGEWEYTARDGEQWLVYKALAYRTPDDPRPGIGYAWEPIPGRTPYTKGSELMNGETSAWGRALAALGIAVHRGIATGTEIRNAESRRIERTRPSEPADDDWTNVDQGATPRDYRVSAKQLAYIKNLCDKAGYTDKTQALAYVNATLTAASLPHVDSVHRLSKHQASTVIELMEKAEPIEEVLASIE